MYHANRNINRNLKQRIALEQTIYEMERQREAALDAIDDIEDDAEYDKAFKAIFDKYGTTALIHRAESLEYPEARNEWFRKFFESFGLVESKEISAKQTEVFLRYAEQTHYRDYKHYYIRVGNRIARISYYGPNRTGFLNITEY